MLGAVLEASFKDDVYRENTTTEDFQREVAGLSGHEEGLFALSGTMGNELALRSLLIRPPHAVMVDSRSHILVWEAGGVASLAGAIIQPVSPSNGKYLTLDDIIENVNLDEGV